MANIKAIFRKLDEVIRQSSGSVSPIAICTDWIVVAEFSDGDGHLWLESYQSENLSSWKRRGILDSISLYESELE